VSDALRRIAGEIHKQKTLSKSLNIARKRQMIMLPRALPEIPGYEIGVVYLPADEISGDFYDVISLAGGNVGFVLGDVTGHGIEAALVMGMAKKTMQIYARAIENPDDVLAEVNRELCPDLTTDSFVTGMYAVLAPQSRTIRVVRAGHPHALLTNAARDPQVQKIPGEGMLIGVDESGKAFNRVTKGTDTVLQPGDSLLLYTDGLDECRGTNTEEFGLHRIMEGLEALAGRPPQEMAEGLVERLAAHCRSETFEDDVTMVVLKVAD
jgi:serine phosphatase RsbU (regulator of sigma subunit)